MVTSHDVARLAGVSQPTVSRALRGDSRVSETTRRRVEAAASELGYVPNSLGRALSIGRTSRVGLLVTDLKNQFYPHIIAPVHDTLGELGYELILMTDDRDRGDIASRVLANGLDGVILATSVADSPVPTRLRDKEIPFVYFNRVGTAIESDSVTSDPTAGMRGVVELLVENGHRRIGAALGPRNTSTGAGRADALRRELAVRGLAIHPDHEMTGPFGAESGAAAVRDIMSTPEPPTAIVCGNDVVALGAYNAALELGLSVPDDLSIVGYDDLPEASWPVFSLTTVAFDLPGMAARAAQLVADRIAAPERPFEHVEFPSELVVRSSVGAAGGR